jgi:hypothetical protein
MKTFDTLQAPPHTEKLLALGWDGIDILHSHLKCLLDEAGTSDGEEPTEPYALGTYRTLCEMYRLTYAIVLAKMGYNNKEGQ